MSQRHKQFNSPGVRPANAEPLSVVHFITVSIQSCFATWPHSVVYRTGGKSDDKAGTHFHEKSYSQHTCSWTSFCITSIPENLSKSYFCQSHHRNILKNFKQAHYRTRRERLWQTWAPSTLKVCHSKAEAAGVCPGWQSVLYVKPSPTSTRLVCPPLA